MKVTRTTTGSNPVSLEELKTFLGFPSLPDPRDQNLQNVLDAAVSLVENFTGVCLIESTFEVTYSRVKGSEKLPYFPVTDVLEDGGMTIDESILRVVGESTDPVIIRYESNYASQIANQAILQCAAALYESPVSSAANQSWKHTARAFSRKGFIL
jgi:hypothetical protein